MPSLIVSSVTTTIVDGDGNFCSLLTIEDHLEVKKTGEVYVSLNNEEKDNSGTKVGRDYRLVSTGSLGGMGSGKFSIYDTIADKSRLTIDNLGKVGIGTMVPSKELDVIGTIKGNQFCIGNDCKTSLSEVDPKVGAVTKGKLCMGDGSKVICDTSPPSETDPNVKAWAKIGNPTTITEDVTVGKLTGTTLCIGTDCKTSWPVLSAVLIEYLVNRQHLDFECIRAGGTLVEVESPKVKICKFSGGSCPSSIPNWVQYKSWSTTRSNSCFGHGCGDYSGTDCSTGEHSFDDKAREPSCSYVGHHRKWDGDCEPDTHYCDMSDIIEIGCY